MIQEVEGPPRRLNRVALVVVPCILTGLAFTVLHRYGAVGDLPLWLILGLLVVGGVFGEYGGRAVSPHARPAVLHVAIGAEILGVTAIIYAIGWGPTLTIGYVFVLARVLDTGGSSVWRITLGWTIAGIVLGQMAIALGLVPTYVAEPDVHGIAFLG